MWCSTENEDQNANIGIFYAVRYISYYISKQYMYQHNSKLTHLPLKNMAAISQTTFLGAFSWMKIF